MFLHFLRPIFLDFQMLCKKGQTSFIMIFIYYLLMSFFLIEEIIIIVSIVVDPLSLETPCPPSFSLKTQNLSSEIQAFIEDPKLFIEDPSFY